MSLEPLRLQQRIEKVEEEENGARGAQQIIHVKIPSAAFQSFSQALVTTQHSVKKRNAVAT